LERRGDAEIDRRQVEPVGIAGRPDGVTVARLQPEKVVAAREELIRLRKGLQGTERLATKANL